MVEKILFWLKEAGFAGLLTAMFLEGSSLPFPGIAVILAYGYILPFDYWDNLLVAAWMSVVYSVASLIPYFIGHKLEIKLQKSPKKGLKKAKKLFSRYGRWSVSFSRPFGLGNYISYVAGMSKMKIITYLLFTFIGIFPWSYGMLLLGNYFNGSYQAFKSFYKNNSIYLYIAVAIIVGIIFLYIFIKNKKNKKSVDE
ncbi:DedA family protein [Virgibacillus sp. DJP39]|uniref:DedA family protein n=1 Tax=Virgibacillus sp. DJP39 TaxID=3409790 RepID=UPI003BB5070D